MAYTDKVYIGPGSTLKPGLRLESAPTAIKYPLKTIIIRKQLPELVVTAPYKLKLTEEDLQNTIQELYAKGYPTTAAEHAANGDPADNALNWLMAGGIGGAYKLLGLYLGLETLDELTTPYRSFMSQLAGKKAFLLASMLGLVSLPAHASNYNANAVGANFTKMDDTGKQHPLSHDEWNTLISSITKPEDLAGYTVDLLKTIAELDDDYKFNSEYNSYNKKGSTNWLTWALAPVDAPIWLGARYYNNLYKNLKDKYLAIPEDKKVEVSEEFVKQNPDKYNYTKTEVPAEVSKKTGKPKRGAKSTTKYEILEREKFMSDHPVFKRFYGKWLSNLGWGALGAAWLAKTGLWAKYGFQSESDKKLSEAEQHDKQVAEWARNAVEKYYAEQAAAEAEKVKLSMNKTNKPASQSTVVKTILETDDSISSQSTQTSDSTTTGRRRSMALDTQ